MAYIRSWLSASILVAGSSGVGVFAICKAHNDPHALYVSLGVVALVFAALTLIGAFGRAIESID